MKLLLMPVRRSPRWRKSPQKPLASQTSTRVLRCYAAEGLGYFFQPILGEVAELLLVNDARDVMTTNTTTDVGLNFPTASPMPGWRILGWRPLDRVERHGPYDLVDPEMADLSKLWLPNGERALAHST